ncbi:hypothetical protein MKZ38_001104 [Zalerion maritima]|uniref:Uncharacterized protein n=1 Tax=Zalerion maritima TaxID=339359 RepID=A0AAD5WS49_9PEZI|nr:hypothetical protein MKZ38_001104 [Zalerion maritima]
MATNNHTNSGAVDTPATRDKFNKDLPGPSTPEEVYPEELPKCKTLLHVLNYPLVWDFFRWFVYGWTIPNFFRKMVNWQYTTFVKPFTPLLTWFPIMYMVNALQFWDDCFNTALTKWDERVPVMTKSTSELTAYMTHPYNRYMDTFDQERAKMQNPKGVFAMFQAHLSCCLLFASEGARRGSENVTTFGRNTYEAFTHAGRNAKDTAENVVNNAKATAESAMSTAAQNVRTAADSARSKAQGAINNAQGAINNAREGTKETVQQVAEQARESVNDATQRADAAASDLTTPAS